MSVVERWNSAISIGMNAYPVTSLTSIIPEIVRESAHDGLPLVEVPEAAKISGATLYQQKQMQKRIELLQVATRKHEYAIHKINKAIRQPDDKLVSLQDTEIARLFANMNEYVDRLTASQITIARVCDAIAPPFQGLLKVLTKQKLLKQPAVKTAMQWYSAMQEYNSSLIDLTMCLKTARSLLNAELNSKETIHISSPSDLEQQMKLIWS